MGGDRELLEKFLRGELEPDEIAALEERLDEEASLQRQLGELAAGVYEDALPLDGTTRVSLFTSRAARADPIVYGIELREVIGHGGMGVVQRAVQRSLGRTVAVKTVREAAHEAPLIEEAFLTGYLEHPNIVPVHEIAQSESGEPLVVLKHIEGTVWRETLGSPDEPSEHLLEWHLRVLVQVCQALRYAHSRGIIHRDIKPSNVMIGEFDEVYLLDWGLAVCLHEGTRLPSLADARGVAGTPAYMAPEQFDESPTELGVHTDVYLVGACLYHAAVGEPPQPGSNLAKIKEQVAEREQLELPSHVDSELASIIARAMAITPTDRYASIAELREALEAWLEHRGALALARHGDDMAEEMTAAHDNNDAIGAERAFFDAAFNYRAALESWPGYTAAGEKLDRLVHDRVAQLIALNAPVAARRALAIVQSANPDLHAQVDEAVARHDADRSRLEQYDRGDDRVYGLRTRRWAAVVLGGLWIAVNIVVVALPVTSAVPLLVGTVAGLAIGMAIIIPFRHVLLQVRLNRYITAISLVALVAQVVQLALAASTGRPVSETVIELMLLWSVAAACTAVVVDVRIVPTALTYLAGYALCRLDPSLLRYALPGGAVVMLTTSLAINVITARRAEARGLTPD